MQTIFEETRSGNRDKFQREERSTGESEDQFLVTLFRQPDNRNIVSRLRFREWGETLP